MTFAEFDWLSILLRAMVYAGSIAVAGSVLVRATLDVALISRTLNRQIIAGAFILLVCEPLRYVVFQLAIGQGDWTMAFAPAMRWIAIETPFGHAAGIRLIAIFLVLAGFLWQPVAIVGALAMIGSFLLEGHTLTHDQRPLLAAVLFVHLALVHWWIAALLPLRAALAGHDHRAIADMVRNFGRKAGVSVAILAIAGLVMLGLLCGWKLDLARAYQQGFAVKLAVFAVILMIAAINKFRWTPRLMCSPEAGQRGLRMSINVEICVALAVLVATAVATSFPPVAE